MVEVARAPVRRGAQEPQVPPHHLPRAAPRTATRWPSSSPPASRQARAEQEAGTNPLGLIFPSPSGKHWRSSNFDRRVLEPAYLAAGWRDADGNGEWTWHSLRHVFCTTALFTWKLDATDVSRMAGHANYRITLDMYVGTTAGVLDRARTGHRVTTPGRDEGPGRAHAGSWPARFLLADHGGPACLTLISVSPTSARCALPPRPRNSRRQRPG